MRRIPHNISEEEKTVAECDPCYQEPEIVNEQKRTDERTWISLGNRMFHIEDVRSMFIQANHLIINFDYTDKQVVIHFGYGKEGEKHAKIVFESLREMYGAYKIELPPEANLYPNLLDTAYGDKVTREVQARVNNESTKIKERYRNKYIKLVREMDALKLKIEEDKQKK